MVHQPNVTPFAVRACRISLWTVPALALLLSVSGCAHRRVAMRPIFGAPVAASPVTIVPETACPTTSTMTTTPVSSEPFLNSSSISPSPGQGNDLIRAGGGSPPAADVAPEESDLQLTPPSTTPSRPSATYKSTGATTYSQPTGTRAFGRQSSHSSLRDQAILRSQVNPFVENPEDLFAPPKADRPWKYVVLHHSASNEGSYAQIDRDHRKLLGFAGCGYHFVIGNGTGSPDGQIEVADRWLNQKNGVHCRNGKSPDVNEYGVGICLVGNFDQTEPTPKQIAAAHALVAYLGDRYAIPADHRGTHDQFATGETACPGQYFPTDAILGSAPLARR